MKRGLTYCRRVQAIVVIIFILTNSNSFAGNNSGSAFTTWPDTGQTKCYANATEIPCPAEGEPFYGQDSQHTDIIRSYTILEDGLMVRDNVTGLIWEQKSDLDNVSNYNNPNDADNDYSWCDADPETNGGYSGSCDYNSTEDFINLLNNISFGGYRDWRLPTIKELATILSLEQFNPAVNTIFASLTKSGDYWSSTSFSYSYYDAGFIDFSLGYIMFSSKSQIYYARAVRGGQ